MGVLGLRVCENQKSKVQLKSCSLNTKCFISPTKPVISLISLCLEVWDVFFREQVPYLRKIKISFGVHVKAF